jgi:hypothetical protein
MGAPLFVTDGDQMMTYIRTFALALAVASLAMLGAAVQAAPIGGADNMSKIGGQLDNPTAPIKVHGCNRAWRLAYVPRWGVVAWHRHVGPRCIPIRPRRVYQGRARPGPNCARVGTVWICW